MKNKSGKIGLGTVILIFIVIILVGISVTEYYYIQKQEEIKQEEIKQENDNNIKNNESSVIETIPTSDLVTLYYEANNERANVFYAYIEDGYLYYFNDYVQGDDISEGAFDFISSFITSSNNKNNIKKYTKLNNIKRIKTYNAGTGVDIVSMLITENGDVYTIDFYSIEGIKVEKYEELKDYKVEDILSFSGEMHSEIKLLLKDGTIKEIK